MAASTEPATACCAPASLAVHGGAGLEAPTTAVQFHCAGDPIQLCTRPLPHAPTVRAHRGVRDGVGR
eukprot:10529941-Lingulodinium_polyedra.AAC.1